MADIQRRSTRIKLFDSQSVAAASGVATSVVWNITPGQAFSLWTEALSSSAAVTVVVNLYPDLNGGGTPVSQTVASSAAVGILSGTDLDMNEDIGKSVSVTLTNTSASSAATVSQSLISF